MLFCLEAVSGLRVNLAKSEITSIGMVLELTSLAAMLGCKTSALPITYLGLLLGASFKESGVWDGTVERMQRQGEKRSIFQRGAN